MTSNCAMDRCTGFYISAMEKWKIEKFVTKAARFAWILALESITPFRNKLLEFFTMHFRVLYFTVCVSVILILMKVHECNFHGQLKYYLQAQIVFRENAHGLFPNNIQ